jgi:hypothetical protein
MAVGGGVKKHRLIVDEEEVLKRGATGKVDGEARWRLHFRILRPRRHSSGVWWWVVWREGYGDGADDIESSHSMKWNHPIQKASESC